MCDAFEERAAIIEHGAKLPRPWAEALARIDTAPVPASYTPERWAGLVNDAFLFVSNWLPAIHRNDWTPDDVRSLIPLIMGRPVIAVGRSDVTVQAPGFPPERIYCRPLAGGGCRWDVGRRAA